MGEPVISGDTATIEVPDWMKPEHQYTVVHVDGQWVVMPF